MITARCTARRRLARLASATSRDALRTNAPGGLEWALSFPNAGDGVEGVRSLRKHSLRLRWSVPPPNGFVTAAAAGGGGGGRLRNVAAAATRSGAGAVDRGGRGAGGANRFRCCWCFRWWWCCCSGSSAQDGSATSERSSFAPPADPASKATITKAIVNIAAADRGSSSSEPSPA